MDIERLDVHDDVRCARVYDVIQASRGYERPWHQASSLEETVLEWRHEDKAEPREMWLALEPGGEIVGVASQWFPQNDNTSMTWFDLEVHPDHRCRGAGGALLDQLVARAEQEGRTTLVTDLQVPPDSNGHPYRRFLERRQFTLGNTEIMRHLDLPVPAEVLDRFDRESRERWAGAYRLETHVGGVPEELQPSLCAVMNQLAVDAPTGEIEFEAESLTPERLREYVELEQKQGRVRLTSVAVHEESGEVVAYTELILPSGAPTVVWQWGTLVHRDHRGHNLGMAVKVENLRRLQADHPERRRIETANDDTNSWMVSINERLGFRIVELCPAYQRKL